MKRGFTLVEMAVVLVIISMIIGGILVGQNLIRNSELQGVLTEYDYYLKAAQEFKDTFQSLPGDMPTATDLWGANGSCPSTSSTMIFGTTTCNGNGNGKTAPFLSDSSGLHFDTEHRETWYFWRHLQNAGLIEDRVSGVGTLIMAGVDGGRTGLNIPASRLAPAGWTLFYFVDTGAAPGWSMWPGQGHIFIFGKPDNISPFNYGPVLTASEAKEIDTKIDDGLPSIGSVRTWTHGGATGCTPDLNASTAQDYSVTSTNQRCSLIFLTGL